MPTDGRATSLTVGEDRLVRLVRWMRRPLIAPWYVLLFWVGWFAGEAIDHAL